MIPDRDRIREYAAERDPDKRLVALSLLLLLVVLGTGVGTFAFDGTDPGGNATTPTPTAVEITPVTTVDDGDGSGAETPTPGTATETPSPTTAVAGSTSTATPSSDGEDDDDEEEDDDDTDDPPAVDLRTRGSSVLVGMAGVVPGEDGRGTIRFENAGDVTGRLVVDDAVVVDRENSLAEPERALGDDSTTGELSSALLVRLSVRYPGGRTEYLFGSANGYVPLSTLDGANRTSARTLAPGDRATVTLEWTLPRSTGNEVQSDDVSLDVDFVLRQTSR